VSRNTKRVLIMAKSGMDDVKAASPMDYELPTSILQLAQNVTVGEPWSDTTKYQ
jgi:hypothetical protein